MADSGVINNIKFHSPEKDLWLKNRTLLKRFIVRIFKAQGKNIEQLSVIFCSDDYLLRINIEFLQHDSFTDIITFDLSTQPSKINSELYISLDRIKDNAKAYRTSSSNELHRVIFHGLLHLLGYKDKSTSEKQLIRKQEDILLKQYTEFVSRETRST